MDTCELFPCKLDIKPIICAHEIVGVALYDSWRLRGCSRRARAGFDWREIYFYTCIISG